jgi:hypothetical protein
MKRVLTFCTLLMTIYGSAYAQVDSLRHRFGGVTPVKIETVTPNSVRVKRINQAYENQTLNIPLSEVTSLRFADGFEVSFRDGQMVRDNLLSAPKFKTAFLSVLAEDAIALKQDEIRQYYGDPLYLQVYKPYRTHFYSGLVKIGAGIGGFALCAKFNPTVWDYNAGGTYTTGPNGNFVYLWRMTDKGTLSPGFRLGWAFLGGLATVGFLDCATSFFGLNELNHRRESWAGIPTSRARAEFWGGAALTAVGVGVTAFYTERLTHYREWNIMVEKIDDVVTKEIRDGERAPSSLFWGQYCGCIVMNLGISLLQLGGTHLSAIKRLEGTPYAIRADVGPTTSGYGLTVSF